MITRASVGALSKAPFAPYKRNVTSLFGELQIPIIANSKGDPMLIVSASGRYDHYSDFGNTTNPKVGVNFNPPPEIHVCDRITRMNGNIISRTAITTTKRRTRNHSGVVYGRPNFATTKPELQISTKIAGIAAIHRLGGTTGAGDTMGAAEGFNEGWREDMKTNR